MMIERQRRAKASPLDGQRLRLANAVRRGANGENCQKVISQLEGSLTVTPRRDHSPDGGRARPGEKPKR